MISGPSHSILEVSVLTLKCLKPALESFKHYDFKLSLKAEQRGTDMIFFFFFSTWVINRGSPLIRRKQMSSSCLKLAFLASFCAGSRLMSSHCIHRVHVLPWMHWLLIARTAPFLLAGNREQQFTPPEKCQRVCIPHVCKEALVGTVPLGTPPMAWTSASPTSTLTSACKEQSSL